MAEVKELKYVPYFGLIQTWDYEERDTRGSFAGKESSRIFQVYDEGWEKSESIP